MISRKPRAQKKCVKETARFRDVWDSLPSVRQSERRNQTEWSATLMKLKSAVWRRRSFTLSFAGCWLPKWICQLGCAGRQVGEGECWCRDQPRHIDVHYLLILYSPLSYFVIWHLILDKWLFCWLLAQMYDFKVWLLWLFAPRLAALSVGEIVDALLVLLNLFDRACWTRPLISACKEAGV